MRVIPLTQGEETFVDDTDFEEHGKLKWFAKNCRGGIYAARTKRIDGHNVTIRLHREIMQCPTGLEVDHLDGNSLNNQRSNLEIVTHWENMQRRFANQNINPV